MMFVRTVLILSLLAALQLACNSNSNSSNPLVGTWKVKEIDLDYADSNVEVDQQIVDQIIDLEITTKFTFSPDGSTTIKNRAFSITGLYSFNPDTGVLLINKDRNSPEGTKYMVQKLNDKELVILRDLNLLDSEKAFIQFFCEKEETGS
ncbi:hypothetical protein GF407_01620 [candidate division KSB1 bacterium]|nr:hypothetical protein [candidate division KSB1 bacterium]